MGDSYMVAGGLIEQNTDHLAAMATAALAMHEHACELNTQAAASVCAFGLQAGSVIAGVIGIRKFIYDICGDTVNTASRPESQGVPGRTHVSETVFERLLGRFAFDARGTIEIKGRGPMRT
ncbi:MAG: adenylate/guanylate cyclase domain-containing protein [Rhizomicrobium sp.]